MSKREIRGFTVCSNGEHVDSEGYTRCNECKSKTILVFPCELWQADSEPYKSGEEITDEDLSEIFVGEVSGHWCPKCEMLISLSYNFPS